MLINSNLPCFSWQQSTWSIKANKKCFIDFCWTNLIFLVFIFYLFFLLLKSPSLIYFTTKLYPLPIAIAEKTCSIWASQNKRATPEALGILSEQMACKSFIYILLIEQGTILRFNEDCKQQLQCIVKFCHKTFSYNSDTKILKRFYTSQKERGKEI